MYAAIPTFSRNSFAMFSASSFDFFNTFIGPTIQFSNTFKLLNKLNCWKTIPT